jgi:hypothetical protein
MNTHLTTVLLNGYLEDRIRAAAEARLAAEYQRQTRAPRAHRSPRRQWFSRTARV